MKALLAVVAAIQAKAAALSGVQEAPTSPPEGINQFPLAVCFVKDFAAGNITAGQMKRLATLTCQIHGKRQHLPADVELMTPYGDTFPAALWDDPKLGNTVETLNAVRGTFGVMEWAGDQTIGWTFEIDVKVEDIL